MQVLPKLYTLCLLVSLLSACGSSGALIDPRFSIIKSGDKFTDEKVPYGYIGINNLLPRKTPYGFMHYGVYLDPFVFKDKNTNKIISLGLYVVYCHYKDDYPFKSMQSITFLTDTADRIEVLVKPIDADFNIRNWNVNYHCPYSETGSIEIQLDDFEKLALANWIQVEIHGDQGSHTYNRDDVRPSVTKNINIFYKYIINK
jgi:hypothetical protein